MTLLKTSALNGIAVGIRMLTALGLNKVLAYSVGPSGYAVIGQFQNFLSMLTTLAGGAMSQGVTKYTAEYNGDVDRQNLVWQTAGTIAGWCTGVASLLILLLHRQLASWLLHDEQYGSVFIWLGFTLMLLALNSLLLAILSGKKEVKLFVLVTISGSIVGLLVTGSLALLWGLHGALVALAINQSIVVIITLLLCFRTPWFRVRALFGGIDPLMARNLGKYALMALTSAAVVPASQIIIRNLLVRDFGWEVAGHWQAVSKISELYLMMLVSTLSLHYLPRLAEIKSGTELKQEILGTYRVVLPAAILGAGLIYFLRDFITIALFAPSFTPMRDLFFWQVLGDVMKIGSWILAYVMIGHSLTRQYILTEIGFSGALVMIVSMATKRYGISGAPLAYFLCYSLYWVAMAWIVRDHINKLAIPRVDPSGAQ